MGELNLQPKIIQLIDTLDPGGAERMAVNLANEFSQRGYRHLLIVSRHLGGLELQLSDQNCLRLLEKKHTLDAKAFKKLVKLKDQFGAQIIHAHGTSVYWGVFLKWFRPSLKLIWHDHLGISSEVILSNPRKEIHFLSRWIDYILTANESTADFWKSKKIVPISKIRFVSNFPSLRPISKKKNGKFTFLHLANYRSEKGHFLVLNAVKKLIEKGLVFQVRLVGKEVDSEWKNLVLEKTKELDLQDWVSIEGEAMDVSGLLAEVDAGLVASDREGLPVALLEYGLAGLPVISTQVGQCAEVLGQGKYGKIVSVGDVEAFSSAMEVYIHQSENSASLGKFFQKHILKAYGPSQFFLQFEQVLEQLEPETSKS